MLKTLLGALVLAAVLISGLIPGTAPAQTTMFRPVAVVNDSAITGFDLEQRARIMATLGFPFSSADQLRREALERLIEDRLKMQEATRLGINASDEDVAMEIGRLAQRAQVSTDELKSGLRAQGVSDQALNDMVTADLVWREVVRSRYRRRVEPAEAEIDAEIAQLQGRTAVAYKIAEIGLPARDRGRSEAETEALADQLYESLSQGGDFDAAVKRYSRSPSAAKGGLVGWVPAGRLPPDIASMLAELEPGQVTRPFPVTGGLSILRLLETRADETAAVDPADAELRDKVSRRLQNERAGRLAEGLLQDLRRDALIEMR